MAKRLVQRATIILLAFAGVANQDIAQTVGVGRHQVGIWRRRWQRAFDNLVRIECTEDSPGELRHAIEEVLADEPRPGTPGKFTAEQLTLLFALACEPPEQSGLPITHWTGAELAAEAIKRGIVESISASQVNRLLREAQLQPHKSRYWLNTTEKDPELRRIAIRNLGSMSRSNGASTSDALVSIYKSDNSSAIRRQIINSLFIQRNAKALVDLARAENDADLKRELVSKLSVMKTPEATDYMLELLK